jgi:hypothetical protein
LAHGLRTLRGWRGGYERRFHFSFLPAFCVYPVALGEFVETCSVEALQRQQSMTFDGSTVRRFNN